ncbi:MAG TPA: hypothetical protein VK454_13005, partial [Myxococcaceae bacterium]|nr:hypothetical protein [Myxococcaceae bacterium]
TLADVKRLGKRPLVLFTTKAQYSEATEQITSTLGKSGAVQVVIFPERDARGTTMLGRAPYIERGIRNFMVTIFDLSP